MNRLPIKLISLLLLVVLNGSMLLTVGETFGFFSDVEKSENSSFELGILDFFLTSTDNFNEAVTPTQTSVQNVSVINDGTLGFQYNLSATSFSGTLCDHLILNSTLDSGAEYSGALTSLTDYPVGEFSNPDDWVFTVSLDGDDPDYQGESCNFKFVFNGWQTNLLDNTQGFTDTEEISNTITAGIWLIEGTWTQTTAGDFEAGEPSLNGSDEEILVLSSGDIAIAVGEVIPPAATVSSADGDMTHVAANATDGDMGTYWKGTTGGDSWLAVDFGQSRDISQVKIWFTHNGEAEDYQIQISDTADFSGIVHIVADITGNASDYIEHSFIETSGRYIRIYISATTGNPAILEFVTTKRELPVFDGSATLTSQSYENGVINKWISLDWAETLDTDTDIQLSVQTSNNGIGWTAWLLKSGTSPIDLSALPQTRYIRWQAELITNPATDPILTPILHEVNVHYEQENIANTIVMNEFLPNPSELTPDYGFNFGTDSSLMPQGEWVEIYNKGTTNVDLAEWYIEDSEANNIPIDLFHITVGSMVIVPGNYLVVYMNAETLNNSVETIYLKDMFGNIVDEYSYDMTNACDLQPTPDGTNNGGTATGVCGIVPGNKSYARIPDGIGSWIDPIPTPNQPNIIEEEPIIVAIVTPNFVSIPNSLEEIITDNFIISIDPEITTVDEVLISDELEIISTSSEPVIELVPELDIISTTTTIIAVETIIDTEVIEPTEEPITELIEEAGEPIEVPEEIIIEEIIEPIETAEVITEESTEEPIEEPIEELTEQPVEPELAEQEAGIVIEEVVVTKEEPEAAISNQEDENDPEENE